MFTLIFKADIVQFKLLLLIFDVDKPELNPIPENESENSEST